MRRLASASSSWLQAWEAAPRDFREALQVVGLDDPLIWAGIRHERDDLERMLEIMGVLKGEDAVKLQKLEIAVRLQATSRAVGDDWVDRFARMPSHILATSHEQEAKRAKLAAEEQLLERLKADHAYSKPAGWHSRAYRRAEAAGDEKARKKAEERERDKWARKAVRTIVQSGLPFGKEVIDNGWDFLSPEATRCLRGLRAA